MQDASLEYVEGVTMYDTQLHESFFEYYLGQNKFMSTSCEVEMSNFKWELF